MVMYLFPSTGIQATMASQYHGKFQLGISSMERVLRGPPGQALERRVGRNGEVASLVFLASPALSKKIFSTHFVFTYFLFHFFLPSPLLTPEVAVVPKFQKD